MADNLTRLIRDWLTKAAHDLQNARIVSATSDGPLDTAIYHCQKKHHVQQATTGDCWWSRRATPGHCSWIRQTPASNFAGAR